LNNGGLPEIVLCQKLPNRTIIEGSLRIVWGCDLNLSFVPEGTQKGTA
jgi:hypothetical protein